MSVLAEVDVRPDAVSGIEEPWRTRMLLYLRYQIREAGRARFQDKAAWNSFLEDIGFTVSEQWRELHAQGHVVCGDDLDALPAAHLTICSARTSWARSESQHVELGEVALSDAFRRAERWARVPIGGRWIGGRKENREDVWSERLHPLMPRSTIDTRVVVVDRFALACDGGSRAAYDGLAWLIKKLVDENHKIDIIAAGRPSWNTKPKLDHEDFCNADALSRRDDVAKFLELWATDELRSPGGHDRPHVSVRLVPDSEARRLAHDRVLVLATGYKEEGRYVEIEGRFVTLGHGLASFASKKVKWTTFQRGLVSSLEAHGPEGDAFAAWLTKLVFPASRRPVLRIHWDRTNQYWQCDRHCGPDVEPLAYHESGGWVPLAA